MTHIGPRVQGTSAKRPNGKWMNVYRRSRRYDEATVGATTEGYWLNTIKTTVDEVRATVALREKCTNVGDQRMNKCRREWEDGNLLGRPMNGVVTVVWPLC